MLKCVLNDERHLAEVVVHVLPKAFVMCEAKSAAHWSLVTQGCTPRCKSSAEWGENGAKGDSLLNVTVTKCVQSRKQIQRQQKR